MNERIRELADKVANIMPAGVYNIKYDSGKSGVEFTEDALEKFAELIVQECVNVLHDNELWNRHISHALKEHFGVEE